MAMNINDGTHASRLELDRRATGELDGPVPIEHLDLLEAAKSRVAPFDHEILRARSHRVSEDVPVVAPTPRPTRPWSIFLSILTVAAALVLVVRIIIPDKPIPIEPGTHIRGGAFLDTFVLRDGVGQPWEPRDRLTEGDRVQFAYNASNTGDTMVLLSIDGEGTLTVFWPAEGDIPEPIEPTKLHLLEDSIELDDARGPETFVVFFSVSSVEEACLLAVNVYDTEGSEGLSRLAQHDPSIDVVIIDKE